MILQALTKLYDDLLKKGEISKPGWGVVKVGWALCIDQEGNVLQIVPQVTEDEKGKTKKREMTVPAPIRRSSGIASNFLWDNSSYIFGVDAKGNASRSRECFEACEKHHSKVLQDVDNAVAKGIKQYFKKWKPEDADNNPCFAAEKETILKDGANIVFRVDGKYAFEDNEVAEAWDRFSSNADGERIQCLVTGEEDELAMIHPGLKGVRDAQSSGASIVSFNAPAFCSYGKEQGMNAPVGKRAAFAYTTALNHLLNDKDNVQVIGDATVVCWADGAEKQYQKLAMSFIFKNPEPNQQEDKGEHTLRSQDDVRAVVRRLAEGKPCEEQGLSPDVKFYILGMSPNASRISIRFFMASTFGKLMKNINDHYDRMEIAGQKYDYMPLWALFKETVNPNSSKEKPSPNMVGATTRSIMNGTRYPASLLQAVEVRIKAERKITSGRAAIIKAYYSKNTDIRCPKEVLTVSLNENSANIPYTIGRLFAVYEAAQERANPGIKATIRDKYFNAIAATPANVLPTLTKLYQHHIRKLDAGTRVNFDKQVSDLFGRLDVEKIPSRLSLPEQAAFQLGYYHQRTKRFEKKETE